MPLTDWAILVIMFGSKWGILRRMRFIICDVLLGNLFLGDVLLGDIIPQMQKLVVMMIMTTFGVTARQTMPGISTDPQGRQSQQE
tara:strand:+ start:66 stop:320 length:255 start_codon:yes stop_codon:yes gene_type:complete